MGSFLYNHEPESPIPKNGTAARPRSAATLAHSWLSLGMTLFRGLMFPRHPVRNPLTVWQKLKWPLLPRKLRFLPLPITQLIRMLWSCSVLITRPSLPTPMWGLPVFRIISSGAPTCLVPRVGEPLCSTLVLPLGPLITLHTTLSTGP